LLFKYLLWLVQLLQLCTFGIMNFIYSNGTFIKDTDTLFFANNRSFRYGDGFFETIRIVAGTIPLWLEHTERMIHSMNLMGGTFAAHETIHTLYNNILKTCAKNNLSHAARVRVSFYGGNGGLHELVNDQYHYIIECFALQEGHFGFNQNGLVMGVFMEHKKLSRDTLSNLKTSSSILYTLAARYAKTNLLNDVVLVNERYNIVDTSIANIYMVKNNTIFTPTTDDGPVLGCMRSYLMDQPALAIEEAAINMPTLFDADEVFISNAILGIRWVKQIDAKTYTQHSVSQHIYTQFIAPLYQTSSHK
jgi:branched-chain amino acid aminotransferase